MNQAASSQSKATLSSVPPYLRRRLWIFLGIIAVGSVASFVVPLLVMGQVRISYYVVACALPGLAMGAAAIVISIGYSREVRRAIQRQCRVCWNCGYHLDGLRASGTCPECGKAYELGELEALWKTANDKRQATRNKSDPAA